MARRNFQSSGLVSSAYEDHEDADPRVGLVNLADVMLVFACGLMLALVSYWNLDLPEMSELEPNQMQEVDDAEQMTEELQSSSNAYMELGKVYQDPRTGKMYILTQSEEDQAAAGGESSASSASSDSSQAQSAGAAQTD